MKSASEITIAPIITAPKKFDSTNTNIHRRGLYLPCGGTNFSFAFLRPFFFFERERLRPARGRFVWARAASHEPRREGMRERRTRALVCSKPPPSQ